ncbi:MAG: hypothetical protein M3179_08980 [Actinomycetota bacterium]|nr:hypothetical protein [Actinomycetota bacterium]
MLAERTGAEIDGAGRISVLPDLTLPGHPEIFVIGDMMALDRLPGVAEVAMPGGHPCRPHHPPTSARGHRAAGVPLPRPRQHGDHRALPSRAECRSTASQRAAGLAGVDVRPPGLPVQLREPHLDSVPVGGLDDRSSGGSSGTSASGARQAT